MQTLQFSPPDNVSKWDLLISHLEQMKFLCSTCIGWLCFTQSFQKEIYQGCQHFLRTQAERGTIQRMRAAKLTGLDEERRYVYHLPGQQPGKKGGHLLIINIVRVAIILMTRKDECPLGEICSHTAEYEVDRSPDGKLIPATQQVLPDGSAFIPDLHVQWEDCTWYFEIDNGTESLKLNNKMAFSTEDTIWEVKDGADLHENCLVSKVRRYQRHVKNKDRLFFVFHSEYRLRNFKKILLAEMGEPLPWLQFSTRKQIENPRAFWTALVWQTLEVDSHGSALLPENSITLKLDDEQGEQDSENAIILNLDF